MKLIAVLILVLFVVFLLSRKRERRRDGSQDRRVAGKGRAAGRQKAADAQAVPANSHRAVSIAPGAQACSVVQAIGSRRYLRGEAPKLPLSGCDCTNCDCRYAHHIDRRAEEVDRRALYSMQSNHVKACGDNKRGAAGGRRSDDLAEA